MINGSINDDDNIIIKVSAKTRLYDEFRILKRYFWRLVLTGFILTYGAFMVFRNVAFYRFKAGAPLKDLGFELLPLQLKGSLIDYLNNIPMTIVCFSLMFLSLFTFIGNSNKYKKPYFINIMIRFLVLLTIGHCLRFMTYSVTSLPGPSKECSPEGYIHMDPPQPTTIKEIFTRIALKPGNNCGDLNFSGHMLQIILPALLFQRYSKVIMIPHISNFFITSYIIFLWILVALQALMIISLRHHYTADIVVGIYTTILLYHFFNEVIMPKDADVVDHSQGKKQPIITSTNNNNESLSALLLNNQQSFEEYDINNNLNDSYYDNDYTDNESIISMESYNDTP